MENYNLRSFWILLSILIVIILSLGSFCFADGMFKGPGAVVPGIPYQAGIIRYKDGEETLIIQSYMEADEGDNFGWIIPLPEEPKEIKQFSSGIFKTLPYCFGPQLFEFISVTMLFFLLVFVVVSFIILRRSSNFSKSIFQVFILFVLFFASAIFVPNYLDAGPKISQVMPQPSVTVLQSGKEGDYQFHVLKSKDSESLNEWLKDNELQVLSENEIKIVNDYIKDEWVFAVLRFSRENKKQTVSPKPVAFTFPTRKPVYPLKLTGMASNLPEVFLYVIADYTYSADGYRTVFSSEMFSKNDADNKKYWHPGRYYRSRLYHPASHSLLWEGCWFTVLQASLDPELASHDSFLFMEGREFSRQILRTKKSAIFESIFSSILLISFFLFIFHIIWMILKRNMKIPLIVYLISFLAMLGVFAHYYKYCDTIDDFHMELKKGSFDDPDLHDLKNIFSQYLEQKNLHLENLTDKKIVELMTNNENEIIRTNRITGEPIIVEDSPGNFMIKKNDAGERILIFYDIFGDTMEFEI